MPYTELIIHNTGFFQSRTMNRIGIMYPLYSLFLIEKNPSITACYDVLYNQLFNMGGMFQLNQDKSAQDSGQ